MNDKYLSKGFESDLPTHLSVEKPASRIVFLPKGIFILLIVLIANVSSHVPNIFAEEQAIIKAKIEWADQVMKEKGVVKTPEDQTRRKKVLVLHALKIKRPWNVLFNRYFKESLQELNLSLENLEIESLDLLQFNDAKYQELMKMQLKYKYRDLKPDIIVVTFASTIKFILENDLFPGIPKIFILPTPSDFEEIPNSVVLPFAHEFKENIEHALTLLPDTKSIYVVAGNGLMDRRLLSLFQDKTREIGNGISFHYLDNLSVEELLPRIEDLPDDSFIYYLTYSLDFQGKAVITRDFSQQIAEHSNRPVFSWLDLHALGIGILGGRVTTTRASATMSVDIIKRVFEGESIDSIKPIPPYVEHIYQWREIEKWDIDLKKLPPESLIQNRPINFFELFKWQIIGGIGILLIETFLILFLLINVRKRKAAEEELSESKASLEQKVQDLRKSEKQLSLVYDSIADILFYVKVEPDDCFRFLSINHAFLSATELTTDQIVGKLIEEVIPEQSIQLVLDNYKKAINENRIVRWEETSVYPSGKRIGAVSIAPVLNEKGICTHLVGSVHDITEHRQAEETLRDSEERYELAVAGSAAGLWDWDIRNEEVYYSDRFQELLGYTAGDFSNSLDEFWSRLHPDDTDGTQIAVEKHLKEGATYFVDYRLQTKSGEYRWFHARGQALWDKSGKATRMSGSITDITERKTAEEVLKQKERNLAMAQKIVHLGSWEWNIEDGSEKWSDEQFRIFGYEPGEIEPTYDHFIEALDPEDRSRTLAAVQNSLDGLEPYGIEFRIVRPDKTVRVVFAQGEVFRDEKNKPVRMVGTILDITERKKTEEELIKSEEQFRNLMEQSPLAIEILMPDGRISQVNDAWIRLWGTNEEVTAQVLKEYNMLTDKQLKDLGVLPMVEKAFAGQRVVLPPIEYSGNRAAEEMGLTDIEAKSPWIQCHLYPVKDANGEIEYIVNTYMDITELKQAEQEARVQRDALARVDRATRMGQLTGSIAHELNQPLTGILSNAQAAELMINSDQWEREEFEEVLAEIVADTKRAGDVIRNLRELYREQKGEYLPVDINAVADEATHLLHSEFVLQHIVLAKDFSSSIPMVNGNRIQLQQVLVNLIMNGEQAMSDVARDDRQLHITTTYDANEVKVWVEDCGPGIDADKIDRIFEPMTTWKPGGTGMGLAIGNSIIEAHGGRMWAENRPEGGARVGFALPVHKQGKKA